MAIINVKKVKLTPSDDEETVLRRMKKRVTDWFDYYSENNLWYREDTQFTYRPDGQWNAEEIREYKDENKPFLSFNMIPRMLNVIEGEFTDFSPDIMVRPIDSSTADQEKIDLLTNLMRFLAFKSRNDIVYQTAINCALTGGYGAMRIISEPENEFSFNFVPRYIDIHDPTKAFWDRSARNLDKSDGVCCGIVTMWNKERLKAKYPEIGDQIQSFSPVGIESFWETKEEIAVAEYYEKKYFKRRLALLSNNMVVDADQAEEVISKINNSMVLEATQPPPVTVVKEEERDDYVIHYYRAIHNKILEKSLWDGKKLPVIFQAGIVKWYEGKEHTYSWVRFLKDTQRAYNYARSEFLYRLKLTRYEPFIAPEDAIQGYEKNWKNIYSAKGVLPYKRTPDGSKPERVGQNEIPQSLSLEIERAYSDFQRISGRFDANLGAPSNETSGVAILNRQRPGNMSVKIFFDNALKAIESAANVSLDLAQNLIDTTRQMATVLPNGEQNSVVVNDQGGRVNNITDGMFNVEIKASASFEIQREAQLEQINNIIRSNPELAAILPDKMLELSGIKDAPQLIKRAQLNLIPQITAQETKDPQMQQKLAPILQQRQQQQNMQQQAAQLEMLAVQSKTQDDRIRALADQMDGMANMMNAQTNQAEAQQKGALEAAKIVAEDQRTEMELQKEVLREIRGTPLNTSQFGIASQG